MRNLYTIHKLYAFAVIAMALDGLSTWFCLTSMPDHLEEGNPFSALGMTVWGLEEFLLLQFATWVLLLAGYCFGLRNWFGKRAALVIWSLIRYYAAGHNLYLWSQVS